MKRVRDDTRDERQRAVDYTDELEDSRNELEERLRDYKPMLRDFHDGVHAFLKNMAKEKGYGPGNWPDWVPQLESTMRSMEHALPEVPESPDDER